ncbi:hypothetical protein HDU81_001097 [Chytriomyces hyalinus]|nr:hypothetical protein HDU81_001097 [Chytriomyces hyalinus]
MMSPEETETIVKTLCTKVRANYVSPEDAEAIASGIEAKYAAGAYASLTGPALAEALGTDLKAVNGDKHLRVAFDAEHPYPEEALPVVQKYNDDGDVVDEEGNVVEEEDEPESGFERMFKELSTLSGDGVAGVSVLTGNVGYINLTMFGPEAQAQKALQHAMTLVKNTAALIIDVRNNMGGDSSTELISYFTAQVVPFKNIYWRPTNRLQKFKTYAEVLGPRYNDNKPESKQRPVYVLIGPETFSSAEAFVFFMRELGLAKTIGQNTSGGGNPCNFYRLGHDSFRASISIGRSTSPVTGKGWEGVGVPADIECPAEEAKDKAHLMCMKYVQAELLQKEGGVSQAQRVLLTRIEKALSALETETNPAVKPEEPTAVAEEDVPMRFETRAPGVYRLKNPDGSIVNIERIERKFLGIKFVTEKVVQ